MNKKHQNIDIELLKLYEEIAGQKDSAESYEPVFHYTSLETLAKILESSKMHFTHYSFLNDYSELIHGFSSLLKMIFDSNEDDPVFQSVLDRFKTRLSEDSLVQNICVGSFSSHGNSLSQWRGYGDSARGICIRFNQRVLWELCRTHDFVLAKVTYTQKELDKFYNRVIVKHKTLSEGLKLETVEENTDLLFNILKVCSLFIKHAGFAEESEYRIVSQRIDKLEHKNKNGLYVPYCDFYLGGNLNCLIEEIIIGPAADQELVLRSVKVLLNKFNLNEIDTSTSKIPYRVI